MGVAVVGLLPLDAWFGWTGETPTVVIVVVSAVAGPCLYWWRRLRCLPKGVLAVRRAWPVRLVAFPDTTDVDGNPWLGDVEWILFTPGVDRTLVLPVMDGSATRSAALTIRSGRLRFDGLRAEAPVPVDPRLPESLRWLEPGVAYDHETRTLLVTV
ncbi:hypothetical protein JS531_04615 [Bifidobacterium sp. CP2]|uniref:hypothetical protein n=1 Tax=Bifidobacterium sp. CP2 TaxID=2809025 RepID=UPI001BDD42CC|nr:hypothetical protein [Bifidobacterium sp. CP2]MBT1181263.1 hypothetical protein [Bifidobacterium sp. CP2]